MTNPMAAMKPVRGRRAQLSSIDRWHCFPGIAGRRSFLMHHRVSLLGNVQYSLVSRSAFKLMV